MVCEVKLHHETATYGAYVELLEGGRVKAGEYETTARTFASIDEAYAYYRPIAVGNFRGPHRIVECLQNLMDERNDGL